MSNLNTSIGYFKGLIDQNGIVQFSRLYEKDHAFGYAIEDQARSLIVALWLKDYPLAEQLLRLVISAKHDQGVRMIRNIDGTYTDQVDHFEEACAEVLWALSESQSVMPSPETTDYANFLTKGLIQTNYSRVMAYALLGTSKLGDIPSSILLADKLVTLFQDNASTDWQWFEHWLTYANALHPWSLLSSFQLIPKPEYLQIGLASLDFLLAKLKLGRIPVLVGNEGGWWLKGETMPLFDQQPIDAAYLTLACLKAYEVSHDLKYLKQAKVYYAWFHGNNIHRADMIRSDGACYDGLGNTGVNLNGGAESTICYLLASLAIEQQEVEVQA